MAKEIKFRILYNLESLNDEQRAQYLRDASEYFRLDPDLNGLDLIWMNEDSGSGLRKLVVYARKGTTDILRGIHRIEVSGLTQHDGPGYVSFTATGRDSTGRQEIAVGAHSVEGLTAQRLADAVMTAQTRALRRLTLQFVGGGLLDVSEVSAQLANIASPGASLAQLAGPAAVLPPPTVTPPAAAGKDVTPAPSVTKIPDSPNTRHAVAKIPVAPPTCLDCNKPLSEHPLVNSVATCAAPEGPASAPTTPEPPKRTRKKRNTVSLALPGQQTEMPAGQIDANGNITSVSVPPATAKEPEQGVNGNGDAATPALAESFTQQPNQVVIETPQPIQVAPQPVVVTATPPQSAIGADKQKEYRERLGKYSADILPRAGMLPSDGVGGVTMKLRKFAAKHSGVDNAAGLNEEQFEDLFEFLDGYTAKNGAPALVQYINQTLGVK